MESIKHARKTAKRLAKLNGSSYQSELNAIAKDNGHASWGSYLRSASGNQSSLTDNFMPSAQNYSDAFAGAKNLSHHIISGFSGKESENYLTLAQETLTSLILIETSRAQKEARQGTIADLKEWLINGLREIDPVEEARRLQAIQNRHFYIGDSHKTFFTELAKEAAVSAPHGAAHTNMIYIVNMAPAERLRLLAIIVAAITGHLSQKLAD